MTAVDRKLSRRAVLTGTASLVIGMHLPLGAGKAQSAKPASVAAPNAFIRIAPDNTVTVIVKHLEMGQGPLTGLSTLAAEELDADWSQIRANHAPSNARLYQNFAFGAQGTGGSTAIANSYLQMRRAGAAARAMLVQAAAMAWDVPAAEITVVGGVLRHEASNRTGTFGQFADAAAKLPVPKRIRLKKKSEFRLIGRDRAVERLDVPEKSDGRARFTIDIQEPGLLTVVVARPPRFGATVASIDSTAAKAVKGVVDVKKIDSGVAVYATAMWPAIKGREALEISWDEQRAEARGTEELVREFKALAGTPGVVAGKRGDVKTALAESDSVIEAAFVFPYLAHAPMEPLDGYMRWNHRGAVARYGAQLQTLDHLIFSRLLGLPQDRIQIETLIAGGSFGRRAQFTPHFATELAQVAKAIGPDRPVKLVWTREDDIRGGFYRPLFVHRLRGALKDGRIAAWQNTIVGQSFIKGTEFERYMMQGPVDRTMVEGSKSLPYDVPHFRCEAHIAPVGVPVLWWRSVGLSHTGYAVECFVDELLEAAGRDPVAGRLAMMGKHPRQAAVLRAAAKQAGWNGPGPKKGRARGVAVVESFGTPVAQIAEVSIGAGGAPRVHKVWCAVDCGVAVNPDIIRAQMEGGIGFGLGHVLFGEIELDKGRVAPSNFDTYRSLRINEMPDVEVAIVNSNRPPSGVGEPGVPPIGPAVANAMARLGKTRPRRLPMVRG